jgi:23S rRNA pseudouridine1911/1915/1917 synthase
VAEEDDVELPIAHDPKRPDRMVACTDEAAATRLGGRPASTRYTPVVRYQRATLVRVTMRSGVRHQVRVHLAAAGYPIAGDRIYGPPTPGRMIGRQALHASRVRFRHPRTGDPVEIESPLPPEFEAALKRLRP